MNSKTVAPIGAFKIGRQGQVEPIEDAWPDVGVSTDETYRWLHFDLNEPGLADWLNAHLPGSAAAALLQSETRPRCDILDDGLILNLRGIDLNPGADPEDMVSVRLWVTATLVVSTRKRKVRAVDELRVKMENATAPATVGAFLFELANSLTRRIETVSMDLEEETDSLEERMIDHPGGLGKTLAPLRMQVIKLRRFVSPQREALAQLVATRTDVIDKNSRSLLRETANRAARTVEELDATRDRLAAIQEHVDAHNAAAFGKNSYILSLVAAIFLPLGFLTGLFGVNVSGMPGMESPYAFTILSVMSVLIAVVLYLVFRLSKWL